MGKVIPFETFQKAMKRRRKAKGDTGLAIATRAGIDASSYSRYESGKRRIAPEVAVDLARAHRDRGLLLDYCRGCPIAQALEEENDGPSAA